MLSVQYALHLFGYILEWRKNPQCSVSCCLALLLPLTDLQGDIRGVTGTDLLNTQLQSGDFEIETLQAAVKDSGVIDVTIDEREEDDDDTGKDGSRQVDKNRNKTCDQETQTECMSLLKTADVTLHALTKKRTLKITVSTVYTGILLTDKILCTYIVLSEVQ